MFETLAWANTGTVEPFINAGVTLIIVICALVFSAVVAGRGLQIILAHDLSHAIPYLIALAIGGSLIVGAKPVSAFILSQAVGMPLAGRWPPMANEAIGEAAGVVAVQGMVLVSMVYSIRTWRQRDAG